VEKMDKQMIRFLWFPLRWNEQTKLNSAVVATNTKVFATNLSWNINFHQKLYNLNINVNAA